MSHLTLETLARLIDEAPDHAERSHLDLCGDCRAELDAMVEQRLALGTLPALAPAPNAWPALRRRLLAEGLIRPRRALGPGALRAAAAVILFIAGGALGWGVRGQAVPAAPASPASSASPWLAEAPAGSGADPARGVEAASEAFLAALDRYMAAGGGGTADPAARLAALENIVLTTAEALHESPADPVISSYHLTALAQREAVLRQLAVSAGRPVF